MKSPAIRSDKVRKPQSGQLAQLRNNKPQVQQTPPDFDFGANLDQETAPNDVAGLGGLVNKALGTVNLPSALRLVAALESASDKVGRAESAVPGLSEVVRAVIDEEVAKINRYISISGG